MGASHRYRLAWWRDESRSQRRRRRQDRPLPSRNAPPRTTCPEAPPKGGPRRLIVGTKENGHDDFGEFRRDIPEPARQCRPGNAGSIRAGAHCTTVERQCLPGRPVPGHAQLPAHERMPHHATLGGLPIRRTTGKAAEFGIGQSMCSDISPARVVGSTASRRQCGAGPRTAPRLGPIQNPADQRHSPAEEFRDSFRRFASSTAAERAWSSASSFSNAIRTFCIVIPERSRRGSRT